MPIYGGQRLVDLVVSGDVDMDQTNSYLASIENFTSQQESYLSSIEGFTENSKSYLASIEISNASMVVPTENIETYQGSISTYQAPQINAYIPAFASTYLGAGNVSFGPCYLQRIILAPQSGVCSMMDGTTVIASWTLSELRTIACVDYAGLAFTDLRFNSPIGIGSSITFVFRR